MLVHICCSVDSHYFLQKIQEEYPKEKIIGFFYDPNIHPYSEYKLRLLDVRHSCNKLGIELIEGEYDLENWLSITKGLESEPEKGDRCTVCFENRLETTVQKALRLNEKRFTTTLLISPKKSQDKLEKIGKDLAKKYDMEFIFKDYRSGKGMELQAKEVKQNKLYRQNYCGCLYALNTQREQQEKLADELMSPINRQVLPESIEERIELYEKRDSDENLQIVKQRFLNYRVLNAKVSVKKEVVPSYFLAYSTLKSKKTKGKIEKTIENISYMNRDEVKIVTLEYFNKLSNQNYKDIYELNYNPLSFEDELVARNKIVKNSFYDLSCVIVLDEILDCNFEIYCNSVVFDDVREMTI
ncbi:MAG: epoxyqueuosine reductase QueH [Campylobacterota bacterium]|nr:epoxyqueuosine reductase QueH [Campylobacterota bacterium]